MYADMEGDDMILNLHTEEFCPDNCPYCDIVMRGVSIFNKNLPMFVCGNAGICKFVYDLAKKEQKKEGEK